MDELVAIKSKFKKKKKAHVWRRQWKAKAVFTLSKCEQKFPCFATQSGFYLPVSCDPSSSSDSTCARRAHSTCIKSPASTTFPEHSVLCAVIDTACLTFSPLKESNNKTYRDWRGGNGMGRDVFYEQEEYLDSNIRINKIDEPSSQPAVC